MNNYMKPIVSSLKQWVAEYIKNNPGADGKDGVSPTVTTSKSGKVTTITITDANGTKTATINDGSDGAKGDTGPQGEKGAPGEPGKDAVVDATLTQSGQAADAKVTGDALALKLTEPSTGLAVGRYFRIAAIDESGHAVLEAVDEPVGGVQDVLVNGASIVADGVANVPIATGRDVIGLVKVGSPINGIGVTQNGLLALESATNTYIKNRQYTRPITPSNLDYAVKTAMCDGKGAAWTADEQAAARERMGIDKPYELIESITLEEKVSEIYRTLEPDGTEYNFRDLTIQVYAQKASGTSTFDCFITDSNNASLVTACSGAVSESMEKTSVFSFERYGGYILPKSTVANSKNELVLGNCLISPASFLIANGTIKSMQLKIRAGYSEPLPVGTEIKIYGVRV